MSKLNDQIAEIVLPCGEMDETLTFFSNELGFQLESIYPADNPIDAVIYGFGLRIRLKKDDTISPGVITITGKTTGNLTAPNGTEIRFKHSGDSYFLPKGNQSLQISKLNEPKWKIGRAGMEYRNLISDRYGGRFIASHIRIQKAGPVPDYVHYHKIRFQMIYCYKGWAKVVYEDQGDPFIFTEGDCVLQPPEIRHRVLENSDQFEVIEITSPASHMTCTDPNLELPNSNIDPTQIFNGQTFIIHKAENANWEDWRNPGFVMRDIGIAKVTNGLAQVQVVKSSGTNELFSAQHDTEFHFIFLLHGNINLQIQGNNKYDLVPGDSITIPSGMKFSITQCPNETEFLEILFSEKNE